MSEARLTLMEAIARKQVVAAQYNGEQIKLAPHLLFERRGDLFVHALNMNRRSPGLASSSWRVLSQRSSWTRNSRRCRPSMPQPRAPMMHWSWLSDRQGQRKGLAAGSLRPYLDCTLIDAIYILHEGCGNG